MRKGLAEWKRSRQRHSEQRQHGTCLCPQKEMTPQLGGLTAARYLLCLSSVGCEQQGQSVSVSVNPLLQRLSLSFL